MFSYGSLGGLGGGASGGGAVLPGGGGVSPPGGLGLYGPRTATRAPPRYVGNSLVNIYVSIKLLEAVVA